MNRQPPPQLQSIHPAKLHDVRGHFLLPVSTCSLVGLETALGKMQKGTSGTGGPPK
ncbi:hypothetical protein ACSS6W_009103 [Trichoderma asperelloides]